MYLGMSVFLIYLLAEFLSLKKSVCFQTRAGEIYFFDKQGISLINQRFGGGAGDFSTRWLFAEHLSLNGLELPRKMAVIVSSFLRTNFKHYQKQFVEGNTVYFPEWSLREVDKFCNVLSLTQEQRNRVMQVYEIQVLSPAQLFQQICLSAITWSLPVTNLRKSLI
jgi:hypothetical protein